MVGDVVFVDLNHGPPRIFFIIQFGLSTNTNNPGIIRGTRHKPIQRVRFNSRIRIHHENVLIEGGVNSNDITHLMVDLKFQRRHGCIEMDTVEVMQEEELGITLAAIARSGAFSGFADFDYDHVTVVARKHQNYNQTRGKTHGTTWPSNSYRPEYTLP